MTYFFAKFSLVSNGMSKITIYVYASQNLGSSPKGLKPIAIPMKLLDRFRA